MITPDAGPKGIPEDTLPAMALLGRLTGGSASAKDLITGAWWPQAAAAGPAPVRLAQRTMTMPGTSALPSDRGGGAALPSGAVRIGGAVVVADMVMRAIESVMERKQVEAALERFGLDRGNAAHVLSARAYVWGVFHAPRRYWGVPYSGPVNEQVAQAIGRFERDNPGTLGRATDREAAAGRAIDEVVRAALAGTGVGVGPILERRRSDVAQELDTDSAEARKILKLQTGNGSWAAHHLLPFVEVARLPRDVQLAMAAAGWLMDSVENLRALPSNFAAHLATGASLPYHAGGHPQYNAQVRGVLVPVVASRATGPALRRLLARAEGAAWAYILRVAPLGLLR